MSQSDTLTCLHESAQPENQVREFVVPAQLEIKIIMKFSEEQTRRHF